MPNYTLESWGSSTLGTSGGIVEWSISTLIVQNQHFSPLFYPSSAYMPFIRAAFDRWEAVTNIDFQEVSDSSNSDIRVGFATLDGAAGSTIGQTWITTSSNAPVRMEIAFDNDEPWVWNASNTMIVERDGNVSFYAVALHEIGHAIGLDHYDLAPAIMNSVLSSSINDLTTSDLDGIHALYGFRLPGVAPSIVINGSSAGETLVGGSAAESIFGFGANDILYGGGGNDWLYGGDGRDVLFGDAEADRLAGGPGDDLYSVDNSGDVVVELAGEGYDEVYSSVSYALPANLETLFLSSAGDGLNSSAIFATGNSNNNALIGNNVDNIIQLGTGSFNFVNGLGGNDIIIAGPGHDQMMGGAGNDLFRFDAPTAPGASGDFLYDFTIGQDHIQLNAGAFGIGTNPLVAGVSFISTSGTPAPTTAVPTLEYSSTTGYLFYDADGIAAGAPVVLALLNGVPDLHASDFSFF